MMRMITWLASGLSVVGLACLLGGGRIAADESGVHSSSHSGTKIVLKHAWIETYKHQTSIDAKMFVDKAHDKPNAPSKDGDLHVAGRSPEDVGLPVVAEMMNARERKPLVTKFNAAEGSETPLAVSGAWRLWCEHAGERSQIQGQPLQPFSTTNPDHVFEIHPISAVDGEDVRPTWHPIAGFRTKEAHDAFTTYEQVRCRITSTAQFDAQGKLTNPDTATTTILTTMAGYNYVEFVMQLNEKPRVEASDRDGMFVFAQARDLDGELIVRKVRMVLVKGTEPEEEIRKLDKGARIHVLGIPRIDLALVSWRVRQAAKAETPEEKAEAEEILNWDLPYEIVVCGLYEVLPEE